MENVIVGIGEILWDVFGNKKVLGGAPANFVYHTSQFNFDSFLISAVGNDPDGIEIIDKLRAKGVKVRFHQSNYPTGTVIVDVNKEGTPQYQITEDVAWDNLPYMNSFDELAPKTIAVYFGSLAQRSKTTRSTIRNFLSKVPENALKIFDANLRQDYYNYDIIESSLRQCNILKITKEELKALADLFEIEGNEIELCHIFLHQFNLKMVILTKRGLGSYIITPTETSFEVAPSIVVVDRVGSDGAFTAAFIAAYLKGKTIVQAHQLAVEVGAFVCTQRGAMPLLPDNLIDVIENS